VKPFAAEIEEAESIDLFRSEISTERITVI